MIVYEKPRLSPKELVDKPSFSNVNVNMAIFIYGGSNFIFIVGSVKAHC
jgi:hypothetical protein